MHNAKWQTVMTALLYQQSPGTFANDLAFHCVEEKRNQSTESSGVFSGFSRVHPFSAMLVRIPKL